ncbi:Eco57I restriction-modification methylase domain-containing protein [Ruegeria atlantica]|uniref:site-specific DNA-methyltransferase (adenine-specific) n=1 Tax=Ruegeria atlantica TaxID=81569 RepID=A0A0P1EW27_9RHOB|nr:hypothetical protein [Ruegeria atlantica]CUH46715.1 type II restriction m6 adenine DNA methyltransferase, Alw26I/Eco31I/Esp3I family [Ruegeria atlantica]
MEQIGAKAKRFRELRKKQGFVRATAAANLYVAAFLLPKVVGAPVGPSARTVPTTEELWMALNQGKMRQAMVDAPKAARRARAFHWPLEFPDIMQHGGFDVVLGNPPCEVMQLSEREFFASRAPDIATLKGVKRKAAIQKLKVAQPQLFASYEETKRNHDSSNEFARSSNRFELTATGKMNTYSLFCELAANLVSGEGRVGIIVPTGIATADTNKAFFARNISDGRVISVLSFYETRYWFTQTDDKNSFCLLTLGRNLGRVKFVFDAKPISDLNDDRRVFELSGDDISRLNPLTRTASVFKSRIDAEITAEVYKKIPVLAHGGSDKWNVQMSQGLFNMTSDSGLFLELPSPKTDEVFEIHKSKGWVPLYEAKMMHQYNHRWSSAVGSASDDIESSEAKGPCTEVLPRYIVEEKEVNKITIDLHWKRPWSISWRRNARNSDERTIICCALPESFGIGDSLFCLAPKETGSKSAALLANLNSLPLDYLARQKVSGVNVSFYFVDQFPILPPSFYTEPRLAFITPKVLELTYTSHSLAPFARDLGHDGPPFAWDEDRRALLRADLDAFYARAYGLTRDELRYILDPADVKGPDYPSETFRVLKEKEIRQHGEYRTRRLVLEAWDRMEANGDFSAIGM